LQKVLHSQNNGINFNTARDEYVSAWFVADEPALSRDNVFPRVGDYGVRPVFVGPAGDGVWLVNFKLPPGLSPGWQPVHVSASQSGWSNEIAIAVDMPAVCGRLRVRRACDGVNWRNGRAPLQNGRVSLWISGLPANADLNNVRVYLGPARLIPDYLQPEPDPEGYRQLNARLPRTAESGAADLVVRFGDAESDAFPFVLDD